MGQLLGLRYRYDEPATAPLLALPPARLDLSGLPAQLVCELKLAAEKKRDLDAVRLLLAPIRQAHGEALAQGLAALVAQYRFDRIVALCDEASGSSAHTT